MARSTKEFDVFGVNYRTKQFSAVYGLDLMEAPGDMTPYQLFVHMEVEHNGEWIPASSRAAMNSYIKDLAGVISPLTALRAVMAIVTEFNFAFLTGWNGVKVPGRFLDGAKSVVSVNARPLVAQLQSSGVANLKDLEEYYSLEDAFKMFDINMAKGVSDAYAQEAASKAQGRR